MYYMQDLINTKNNSTNHSAFQEDEYAVVKFHPGSDFAFCVYTTFDFCDACDYLRNLLNNFFNDPPTRVFFTVKRFYDGTLQPITNKGQINWELAESPDSRCELVAYKPSDGRSNCTYIHRIVTTSGTDELDSRYQDFRRLFEDIIMFPELYPTASTLKKTPEKHSNNLKLCQNCQNYHGQTYRENKLICAIHPYGFKGDSCPDFSTKKRPQYLRHLLKKKILNLIFP